MIIPSLKRRRELMGADDGGVALISAMLFIVIMAGLSLVLLSVVMSQLTPTYLAQKSTQTISAARAGVQAALGQLRTAASVNAQTTRLSGDLSKLPCTLSSSVDGTATGIRYEVGISYYTQDPTGRDSAWIAANDLTCSPTAGLTVQPTHALIVSLGDGPAIPGRAATFGDRTITAVYTFSLSNINIPGGRIFNSNKQFCLQASGLTAGSTVKFVRTSACTDKTTQLWLYASTYQIKLASTTANGAAGLCITGPMQAGGGTANALLQPCRTDAARWNQLWSWTGEYTWRGQESVIGLGTSNFCLSPGASDNTDLTGKLLLASNGCQGTFVPQPDVGAGNAGYGTRQIVNYKEFGRCADVTGENINATWLISYPCKQDPTGTGTFLKWNHKWYYTEPSAGQSSKANQQIYVNYLDNPASKYCLQTPLASGGYPVFALCNGSTRQSWTRYGDTGQYSTSYVFVDSLGRCLSANSGDPDGEWSKLIVTACDGTLAQKWNSPPLATEPGIDGYREVSP